MTSAARLHRRQGRRQSGRMLVEGPVLVGEAASAGLALEVVFATTGDEAGRQIARDTGARLVTVSEHVLARVSTTRSPQSPVAVAPVPPSEVPARGDLIVAWGVADPGNVGALIRVAAAFGFGYCAGPGTAETWAPKVLRAGAGGHFHATIGACREVGELRGEGREIVATVARHGEMPGPMVAPTAVLVGSEARGLPEDVVAQADRRVTIPMAAPTESLNAAIAGAIVAYAGRAHRPGGT